MTRTVGGPIEELRAAMAGVVFTPEDPDYDQARLLWNADADRRPAVVARCSGAPDVVAAVRYAQAEGLEIAVRCGAHSASGQSGVDGGLVVDLSGMRQVTVDPERKRARAGGGALISDLDAATRRTGWLCRPGWSATPASAASPSAAAWDWLTRQAGMACDNVESVEIVVADGRILRASAEDNADLFWAVRGGGGNFGVVTEFEFRLHEVGPIIQFGLLFWPPERGRRSVAGHARRRRGPAPVVQHRRSLRSMRRPLPFVPEQHHLKPGFAFVLSGFGDADEHAQAVDRLRAALPPLVEAVTPMPYTALHQAFDQANCWGQYCYETSTRYAELTDEVIDVMVEYLGRRTSPATAILTYRLDEAYSEVEPGRDRVRGDPDPQYITFLMAIAPDAEVLGADQAWARGMRDALAPLALNAGTYINALAEPDEHRVRAAYGAKYDRLARIKAEYDAGNVFHRNINIKPA